MTRTNRIAVFVMGAVLASAIVAVPTMASAVLIGVAPIAYDDHYDVNEHQRLSVPAPGPLGNDSSPSGRPLTFLYVSGGGHGSVQFNPDTSFSFSPLSEHWSGDIPIIYRAYDGIFYSNTATITIHVVPVNDSPMAQQDAASGVEDTTLTVAAPGVLANDSDPKGDALTAEIVSGPPNGDVTLNADGSYVYRPDADWNGRDSFSYRVSDGALWSNTVDVVIDVAPVNDAPVGKPDAFSLPLNYRHDPESEDLLPNVLTNEIDIDSYGLTASLVSGPSHGTLTLSNNGYFDYRPTLGWWGTDTFTYMVSDGVLSSGPVTVTITVRAPGKVVSVGRPISPYLVRPGRDFLVYGTLSAWHRPGRTAVKLLCYRMEGGKWVLRKRADLDAARTKWGRYADHVKLPSRGRWRLVAEHTGTDFVVTRSAARYMWVR
ncbi:MAG: Ig-like domain-containing protein [Coriobacteriia bacterium]|nr:Ig-like domain-containing protein [Coriobacteriia bacterium]